MVSQVLRGRRTTENFCSPNFSVEHRKRLQIKKKKKEVTIINLPPTLNGFPGSPCVHISKSVSIPTVERSIRRLVKGYVRRLRHFQIQRYAQSIKTNGPPRVFLLFSSSARAALDIIRCLMYSFGRRLIKPAVSGRRQGDGPGSMPNWVGTIRGVPAINDATNRRRRRRRHDPVTRLGTGCANLFRTHTILGGEGETRGPPPTPVPFRTARGVRRPLRLYPKRVLQSGLLSSVM